MTRACQTAKAVSEGLSVPVVEVRGELCEVGGIYTVERKQQAKGSVFSKVYHLQFCIGVKYSCICAWLTDSLSKLSQIATLLEKTAIRANPNARR